MTSVAPEYQTSFTTPFSPIPIHPPQSSRIPVVENKFGPTFNMTSTHTEIDQTLDMSAQKAIDPQFSPPATDPDTADHASFSDPYEEEDNTAEDSTDVQGAKTAEVDDDYAMTFDSDAEETSSRNDVSSANTDHEIQPEPASVSLMAGNLHSAVPESFTPIAIQDDQDTSPHSLPTTFPPTTSSSGDTSVADDSNFALAKIETEQSHAKPFTNKDVANGGIDIQQLLDNITATAEANATPISAIPSPTFLLNSSGLPAHSSLPPRPLVTQKPSMHMAYAPQDDIRKYHAGPTSYPPSGLGSNRPPGVPAPIVAAGAPGTSTDARNTLLPPPPASFQPPPSHAQLGVVNKSYQQVPTVTHHDRLNEHTVVADEGEVTWSLAVQKLYDEFIADERMYVNEGLWDRFPVGSRLFIGNLPTEKVTKRDLFYAFYSYGRLAQVSIKQAYGFVQFHDVAACHDALQREQGQEIRGRKMHLEISKPQKNTRGGGGGGTATASRRSRSPDYSRGVDRGVRGNQASSRGSGYDRFDARSGGASRESEFRSQPRGRDDYRPVRSPSPRGGFRGRDDYGPPRGRDYYDGREGRRTRSRSPYGRQENGRYRQRSPSPRTREADEDTALQIPRRDPRDVPDIQIILMDELDRAFVGWVDGEIRARGIKTEVMILNPRQPIDTIVRRQIIEGVLAITQLSRRSQDMSKIPLQVFDRTGGVENIRFDEYQDLEPKIAGELILRAKQTQISAVPYQQPQFSAGQSYQQSLAPTPTPNLANIVGQLDNATLQQLLGTLSAAPSQQNAPAALPIDLAGILNGFTQPQQQAQPQAIQQQNSYQQSSAAYGVATSHNALASLLGNTSQTQTVPQQQQQSAQQVQNIMAQLAKFRQ